MTCPICDRWVPSDPETGYDIDELCPECKQKWVTDLQETDWELPIFVELEDDIEWDKE